MKAAAPSNTGRRRKLQSFEWTEDSIDAFANSEDYKPEPPQDKMNQSIARVQGRKKEAEEREARKKLLPPSMPKAVTSISTLSKSANAAETASALNEYFETYVEASPDLIGSIETTFPLYMFDDSVFDETISIPTLPCVAVWCNPDEEIGPDASALNKVTGSWSPGTVLRREEGSNRYVVQTNPDDPDSETIVLRRMQICFFFGTVEKYADRIATALRRRHTCICLLKYNYYILNMPVDDFIISTLTDKQVAVITKKSWGGRTDFNAALSETLMREVRSGFELSMKNIIFDSNMLNSTNISLLYQLKIPSCAFPVTKKAPHTGSVVIPAHPMKATFAHMVANTFLSSPYALQALEGSTKANLKMMEFIILAVEYTTPFTLQNFERAMSDALSTSCRQLRQEWGYKASIGIRQALEGDVTKRYNMGIRSAHEYENTVNPISALLDRMTYVMTDVLFDVIHASIHAFTNSIEDLCSCKVEIKSIEHIHVVIPPESSYKIKCLPPLFTVAVQVATEISVLNQTDIDDRLVEIEAWRLSPEAAEGDKCPFYVVRPIKGKQLMYNHAPSEFLACILKYFDNIVLDLQDVPHLRKTVMEKVFFPVAKYIKAVPLGSEWVQDCRKRILASVEMALAPLRQYQGFFSQYEEFVNVDNAKYIADKIKIARRDPESSEVELPVTVNLPALNTVLQNHLTEMDTIRADLPKDPLNCGLFLIDVVSLRDLLLNKHEVIMTSILKNHCGYCRESTAYMEEEFKKIIKNLSKHPETIEELAELEEYVSGVHNVLAPLSTAITDMMAYFDVLDKFKYKVDSEDSSGKWGVYGYPARVHSTCDAVSANNIKIKRQLREEMMEDQGNFKKSMQEIEKEVAFLENYTDVADVDFVAERVKGVEAKLAIAAEKSKQFNARESLFETDATDYEDLSRIQRMFEPYFHLWVTTKEWTDIFGKWKKGKFVDLDADEVESKVEKYNTAINKAHKYFSRQDMEKQMNIANEIKNQVTDFRPEVPAIVTLRNPGMRDRHWELISKALDVDIMPIDKFSTEDILAMNLKDSLETIQKIGESAAKEYQIEQALDKMEKEWSEMNLTIVPYRETGTGVLRGVDDINTILDEQITMTQTIMFSAFKGPFEERIDEWNRKLCAVSDLLEVWVTVQRNWLYLQPIFESADINRQLPVEGKKFATVDKNWRGAITSAKITPKVLEYCDNGKLLEKFKESDILLEQVQKGLSDYLETKRSVFARFYFLSNDELLSILSESKDVKLVQPHLKKCFEGIDKVKFLDDLKIDRLISPEGEEVMLIDIIDPVEQCVEHWMLELESQMRLSVRHVMKSAIDDYTVTPRPKWMQKWAGMFVLNGSQLHWTKEMEELFLKHGSRGPVLMLERQMAQLADMTVLVRGHLNNASRITVGALTVIDVHARDVIMKLVDEEVATCDNFGWTSQLRYYWADDDLSAEMVAAARPYGYEYLGNSFRLVITPLTDKCYLTLMGALQMIFGGAPAGPAGTGKTETTKDLAKALAMQCVVFNCSDGLDFIAMGKFFKGLAACGAWACFDEFNRINIEVLSVIGQQIMSIQTCIRQKEPRMVFEGSDISVSDRFAVFITMNPGYAGRTALPDSLQALFRPVAMMVPDYALIGEIMFFAYGFEFAKECGAKMVTTFKLASEQLSSQPHYDYGMRAVKTVITAAGNLKRAEPNADEMVLLLRALQDVNIPKFLEMDLPLFRGIISDLFPGKVRPQLDYGALMHTMLEEIHKAGLQPIDFFTTKVIQLYEMIVVRHGLMLVGPTGGGKSRNLHILEETLGSLKLQGVEGFAYEKVKIFQLNPKAITMGQMYGQFDPNTMEWQDGIMSTMYRHATHDSPDRKWMVFDGPVDAIWIENMNTVLDDNKKLCLNSGEIIKMSNEMTMMFEVEDLVVASPATVSRVGIIYMEPRGLGLDVLVQSWLQKIPQCIPHLMATKLNYLFDTYLFPSIQFLRVHLKELAPTVDNNLAESLMRILDCYLFPFHPVEGEPPVTDIMIADAVTTIEAIFIFSLIWSVGATTDDKGRDMYDAFLRQECHANKMSWPFPKTGCVYDYMFSIDTKKWIKWMDIIDKYEIDPKQTFSEIVVPTVDSVRNTYLMDLLLSHGKHVLMVGETGTGKTVNIQQYLSGNAIVQGRSIQSNVIPLTLTFSANTSANMTQDQLDSKMDKRRKGVYGPAAGKKFYVYVDDLNMPKRETYGAQPPVELLRQWFDQGGWYDRKDLSFKRLIDMTFIASMGPPGGGRQEITDRFLRHFNMIGYVELSDTSKTLIFGMILTNFLTPFENGIVALTDAVVAASIEVFNTIVVELLPTPSKSHYTFNLRDMAKVFQGMLMADVKKVTTKEQLARLWVHESQRIFADRLTIDEDHEWLKALMKKQVEEKFKMDWDVVVPRKRLIYGDFMVMGVDNKIYDEIADADKFKSIVEEYLVEHNSESKQPMPLVMFSDALEHVARIARVIRQPAGNALLLGVGGSGRQSMTRLATYIVGYQLSIVEIVKGYSMVDWREDIKKILMTAGVKDKPVAFLFSDVQIVNERMVEDINNILNSGDVPNLYAPEDMEEISTACRIDCQKKKIPATKLNIFSQYLNRVRRNIHLCVCMSPLGEVFRNRLRNFPSLVNCCTIDWFTAWPADALQSVGLSVLRKADLGLGEFEENTVEMFKQIHLTVSEASDSFYEILRRRNYVTPTSYLELLSSFGKLITMKRTETATKKDRLQIGLDKLSETRQMVAVMQEELTVLQPQIIETQKEVAAMMIEITADKASAAETKAVVEVEEASANEKAAVAKAIAEDAQRDLDEAIPALEEAVKCLNDLKKADIDEVKSLKTPPGGVVLTIKVCCMMFDVKPIKKNDPNTPGKKFDDYWEAGQKGLLADAKGFLASLFNFDKDNIPDRIIKQIVPFMEDPNFTPAAIERSSKACTAICMWARAMYKYHFVALGVAPKRARLKEAEDELAVVMALLAKSKAALQEVNDRLATLEASFDEAVAKKDMLEKKEASCKVQLSNADKLIGGLGGEAVRWTETVALLGEAYTNILGDVIVSAGTISYLGPFTTNFRNELVSSWQDSLVSYGIPHTEGCNLELTLADAVKIRSWQICSLPSDSLSTQNAIIMDNGRRWSLLIDPQGQANRYIRAMSKDVAFAPNGMDVVKLTDKNFLKTLENGVQFGRWVLLENIAESLDAALEPILLQQKFKQGGQEMMKIGDNIIPYNDTFKFFMTTKLSNPHYAPEVSVKVSLLNFTITESGLEEQLLSVVVGEELPELSTQKVNLVIESAAMNKQLFDIESEILYLLSNSTGNILDDTVLIDTLSSSKKTSEEIKERMREAAVIEAEIVVQSELYRPVAKRASLLYFVIADLGSVDPMYQYSLQWFTSLFVKGIGMAASSNAMEIRVENLNGYFTFSVYNNICRSLFERHKLLFSFILCVKIQQGEDNINAAEYRFLLSGISPEVVEYPLPQSAWLEKNVWDDLCAMGGLERFKAIPTDFEGHIDEWRTVFDSPEPHRCPIPAPFADISTLEKLCVLRCLRRDKIEQCMQDFIVEFLGNKFIQPPPFDLKSCYVDSSPVSPLIFVLSSGSDPNKELDILADDMNMSDRLRRIALGQGQGKKAATMIEKGCIAGDWVMLQNCHLSVSWMPVLEQICEQMDISRIHPEFRLWLTSMPSEHFPTAVLQNGVKITKEPPKGLRANLKSTYLKLDNEKLKKTDKPEQFQKLLFGLAFYHALVVERKKYGPLGWNIPYEFNDTDMDITAAQLELYLGTYREVPYKVLQQLTSVVNYGGRITDDKDMRTSDIVIADYFHANILKPKHEFSKSGLYYSLVPDKDAPHTSYMDYIEQLPLSAEPEVFGMHDNANITCAITDADNAFAIILSLQPRVSAGGGISREDQIIEMAKAMATQLPPIYDVEEVGMNYPTDYHESMNTVLVQELQRYNVLLANMHESLVQLQRALKGLVVLSADLESMGGACFDQRVPGTWTDVSYPSLKPLSPWFKDLLERLAFMTSWVDNGIPPAYWISGFFFPQGFLTAAVQNYARKYQLPIDTVSFSFVMLECTVDEIERPDNGCIIYGLFLEGARWSPDEKSLIDPKPKELFSPMPPIHMLPVQFREAPQKDIYRSPVYKVLTRTGTLSTTGHSTNFVTWIEIPGDKETIFRSSLVSETNAQIKFCDQDYWIKAGVACFCALRY
jgi:dynein heavy chain